MVAMYSYVAGKIIYFVSQHTNSSTGVSQKVLIESCNCPWNLWFYAGHHCLQKEEEK